MRDDTLLRNYHLQNWTTIDVNLRLLGGMHNGESSSSSKTDNPRGDGEIQSVTYKHVTFLPKTPNVWFRQLEALFELHQVTNDKTRFYTAYPSLPPDIAGEIPDDVTSYNELKKIILSLNQKSKNQEVAEALGRCELDGQKPSAFVRNARKKLKNIGLFPNDDVLKSRLLQAMPDEARLTLTGHQTLDIDNFCAVADSVYEILQKTNINVVSTTRHEHNKYTNQSYTSNSNLGYNHNSTPQLHNANAKGNQGTLPYAEGQRQKICRAHIYFADNARSCKPWCKWPGQKPYYIERSSRPPSRNVSRSASPTRNQENY